MTIDLVYTTDSLFTRFYPESKAGEDAWNKIGAFNNGVANIPKCQTAATLKQLRDAGYVVIKRKPTKIDYEKLYKELDELLGL